MEPARVLIMFRPRITNALGIGPGMAPQPSPRNCHAPRITKFHPAHVEKPLTVATEHSERRTVLGFVPVHSAAPAAPQPDEMARTYTAGKCVSTSNAVF
jgi:hypothetical protein